MATKTYGGTHVFGAGSILDISGSLKVNTIELGHDTDTTISRKSSGVVQVETNELYMQSGTDVAIADGGTGASTKTAGFDALSPVTTRGDIIYRDASNNAKLAIGANKSILVSDGTDPAWGSMDLSNSAAVGSSVLGVANGGTGVSTTTAKAVVITNDSGGTFAYDMLQMDGAGELLIGGNAGPAIGTITGGDGMTVTNGGNSISLAADVKANSGIVIDSEELSMDLSASSITGTLAVGDGGTGATSLTSGNLILGNGASAVSLLDATTDGAIAVGNGSTMVAESGATLRSSIGVGTGDSPQFTGIELGAATDTTLSRVSAGVIAVEGDTVAMLTAAQTMTNKTLTSPVLNTGVSGTAIKDEDNMSSNSSTHLATQQSIKAYVDASIAGLDLKESVVFVSDTNIAGTYNAAAGTITAAGNGALGQIDEGNTVDNMRILLTAQSDAKHNGVYVITSAGDAGSAYVLTRSDDFNENTEFDGAPFFMVEGGTKYGGHGWVCRGSSDGTLALNTDDVVFVLFSMPGQTGSAGMGLAKNANVLSVDLNELTTETAIVQTDFVAMYDTDGAHSAKITMSDFEDQIFANMNNASSQAGFAAGGEMTLNVQAISGQTNLASGLAATDELMVNDGGTLKKMDVSLIADLLGSGSDFGVSSGVLSLANDSVGADELIDDSVGAAAMADNAVGTSVIVNDAVTSDKIVDDAVTSDHLADNAVLTAAIASASSATTGVTLAKLQYLKRGHMFARSTSGLGAVEEVPYSQELQLRVDFDAAGEATLDGSALACWSQSSAGAVITLAGNHAACAWNWTDCDISVEVLKATSNAATDLSVVDCPIRIYIDSGVAKVDLDVEGLGAAGDQYFQVRIRRLLQG